MSKQSVFYIFFVTLTIFFNEYYCIKHPHGIIKSPTLENVVKGYGYPYENHTVTTDDGWVLTIGRIPYKPNADTCTKKKGTILIAHGIYNNGAIFVNLGPKKSLGLRLADLCYDIWLYSSRGTRYTKHTNYTVTDKEYWNFSFQELGMYDTSALLKYITHATGERKIHYVGFSQGTTQIVALLTAKPEYQKYILSVQLIAPVVFATAVEQYPHIIPVSTISQVMKVSPEIFYRPFPDHEGIVRDMIFDTCIPAVTPVCDFITNALFSSNGHVKWSEHFPELISLKILAHYAQLHVSDDFQMYDYDAKKNLEIYGSENPPSYVIEKLRSPVHIYHALGDLISVAADVKRLVQRLPNVKQVHFINQTDFGHSDFTDFHNNTNELLHRHLFDALGQYS